MRIQRVAGQREASCKQDEPDKSGCQFRGSRKQENCRNRGKRRMFESQCPWPASVRSVGCVHCAWRCGGAAKCCTERTREMARRSKGCKEETSFHGYYFWKSTAREGAIMCYCMCLGCFPHSDKPQHRRSFRHRGPSTPSLRALIGCHAVLRGHQCRQPEFYGHRAAS